MKDLYRHRRSIVYLLTEMIPAFSMGVFVFILILLMFQALRLTEFVLIHGVGWIVISEIALYLSVSFLPAILPMSLLFAVLMTYNRLSNDSEIIAMKTSGIGMFSISFPALIISTIVGALSAYTLFEAGPWGNRQFEILITKLGQQKAASQIREGTFSEGFF
ncbi:MAG: LptF/LptG family permease, partial [Bdellovibrionales bacterium]|nr:LptF/LptG family permease [Bdellovibrionales bacterium]